MRTDEVKNGRKKGKKENEYERKKEKRERENELKERKRMNESLVGVIGCRLFNTGII